MKKLIVFFIMLVTLFSLSSCVTSNGGKHTFLEILNIKSIQIPEKLC